MQYKCNEKINPSLHSDYMSDESSYHPGTVKDICEVSGTSEKGNHVVCQKYTDPTSAECVCVTHETPSILVIVEIIL